MEANEAAIPRERAVEATRVRDLTQWGAGARPGSRMLAQGRSGRYVCSDERAWV